MASFADIITIYFIMAAVALGAGVLPFDAVNPVHPFVNQTDDGEFTANETSIAGEDQGFLTNLVGPIQNALETVAGGQVLAAMGAVGRLFNLAFWPSTIDRHIQPPGIVSIFLHTLTVTFVFSVLGIIRSSIRR